ncbi:ROK family protein [Streptomyces sp. NBC_00859]|uniref:ROK family transcriptional regulator n=1 Tax=Streptomyces sp. NBC_00859 TaxID=2903682 RepID=UPI00386F1CD5|nr:ROK family transcriptional regulator [Streptomyces sp. NBC_00859]
MAEQSRRTVRDLRRGNRAAVLQRLYFDGPLSRQELGTATGLSSGSISNVVAELAADGLLEEAGVVDSEGGRPRTLLRVAPGSGHLIGIDVGETRVRVELFDLSLGELARSERPLAHHGYDVGRIVGHIRAAVADVLRDAQVNADQLVGVGVGVPGIIARDASDQVVVHGQTVGWDAVPLEAMLRESAELPSYVPFFIDNGAKTLGQAEMWFGGGRGTSDAAVVLFGSGVSACIVVNGELYGGADSRAVEWGHTTMTVGGRRCRCGSPGCLEAYVGADAIRERWLESGGPPAAAADEETALATLLAAALPAAGGLAGDTAAAELLDETAEYLGAGIADLINLFRPERILVGGWAGLLLGPVLLPAVRRYAKEYAMHHPAERVTIDLGTLGADAVTLGAATLPLADFFARGGRHRRHDVQDPDADPAALLRQGSWRPVVVDRR